MEAFVRALITGIVTFFVVALLFIAIGMPDILACFVGLVLGFGTMWGAVLGNMINAGIQKQKEQEREKDES